MRDWMRELRVKKGYTQAELAKEIGISRCYYTQLETKFMDRTPSTRTAKKIADVLGFSWTEFYND